MSLLKLHRWLGLALSLLLLLISVSGVLLVWKPEYIKFTVPGGDETLVTEPAAIAAALDTIVSLHAAGDVSFIQIHPNNLSLYKVFLSDKRYAFHSQQGDLVQQWSSNERWEDWLLDLHHRFLLGNTVGLNMAGFSGILLLPLVLLGFCLWWPNRHAAAFSVWPQGWRPGQLLRSHRNLGVASILPILILAITGVILVYPAESARVILGDYAAEPKPHVYTPRLQPQLGGTQAKLEYALKEFPQATLKWFNLPYEEGAPLLVGVQQARSLNRLGRSHVAFLDDLPSEVHNAQGQRPLKLIFDFIFPMHTGLLPLWYRLLLSVFGLLMMLVSSLGILAWFKRSKG